MPLVSLIIPAFNREKYVNAAVDSVLRQTLQEFELIVWDDGSTDRTVDVATEAARGDPRVRVVRAEHRGVCASLNAAAKLCRGRYLGWVDSDDALAPEALAKTTAVLEPRAELGMVYTQHFVMKGTRVVGVGQRTSTRYSKDALLLNFMTFHFRLMRREVFIAAGGVDESIPYAEDYDLCLRLSELTEIAHLAEPLYFYRVHSAAISATHRMDQIMASREAIQRALQRRGLSDRFEVSVELVGRFALQKRGARTNADQYVSQLFDK